MKQLYEGRMAASPWWTATRLLEKWRKRLPLLIAAGAVRSCCSASA